MILLLTSLCTILLFVIFNAVVIYDEEGFDSRGYNCYGKNAQGEIDERKWKYFIFQKDVIENNPSDKDDDYIYFYNPFFDNLPSHTMIFLMISINNIILVKFFN
jgi:hypothetical protein